MLNHDEPWESSACGYHNVFQDGDIYRMYYKAWQITVKPDRIEMRERLRSCCYAESDDPVVVCRRWIGRRQDRANRAYYTAVGFVIALYVLVSLVTIGDLAVDKIVAAKDYALAAMGAKNFGFTFMLLVDAGVYLLAAGVLWGLSRNDFSSTSASSAAFPRAGATSTHA